MQRLQLVRIVRYRKYWCPNLEQGIVVVIHLICIDVCCRPKYLVRAACRRCSPSAVPQGVRLYRMSWMWFNLMSYGHNKAVVQQLTTLLRSQPWVPNWISQCNIPKRQWRFICIDKLVHGFVLFYSCIICLRLLVLWFE